MSDPRNIKLVIAYDGTDFHGWQRQAVGATIQGTLEEALATMTSADVSLQGAGRTDAGVHALAMVANFITGTNIPCAGFLKGLNSMLPPAIRILKAEEAAADFHARRSALAKTYSYNVFCGPVQLPSERLYATQVYVRLDTEAMAAGLEYLLGEHDFSSFEAAGSRDLLLENGRGAVRTILEAQLKIADPQDRLRFIFKGDGFLRHMVRNIVGTLLEVGKGRFAAAEIKNILAARDRGAAGPTAPAHGLFLMKVHYP